MPYGSNLSSGSTHVRTPNNVHDDKQPWSSDDLKSDLSKLLAKIEQEEKDITNKKGAKWFLSKAYDLLISTRSSRKEQINELQGVLDNLVKSDDSHLNKYILQRRLALYWDIHSSSKDNQSNGQFGIILAKHYWRLSRSMECREMKEVSPEQKALANAEAQGKQTP